MASSCRASSGAAEHVRSVSQLARADKACAEAVTNKNRPVCRAVLSYQRSDSLFTVAETARPPSGAARLAVIGGLGCRRRSRLLGRCRSLRRFDGLALADRRS